MKKTKNIIVFISKNTSFSQKVFDSLNKYNSHWIKDDQNLYENIKRINPDWILVFHWSKIIPKKIYTNFKCLCIHTGNLPEDRGGSPIQNQILNGKKFSKVNLIELTEPVDSGAIYCSKDISLQGNLNDIWDIISETSILLIDKYISDELVPIPQEGKINTYKRKKDNNLIVNNIESIHDQIRMLDGLGYPKTFLEIEGFIFEFSRSHLENNEIEACVKIFKK
jgi:methionyl-tRNA formyltransferase